MQLTDYFTTSASILYIHSFFCGSSARIPVSPFTKLRDNTQTQHAWWDHQDEWSVAQISTWQPQHSQETDIHALGGIPTPIPASERTQNHDLDRPATGIGFSITYLFYLAIYST